ncbi:hypothetical protein ADUPG1_008657, partial [Aduncisulcus paluster]
DKSGLSFDQQQQTATTIAAATIVQCVGAAPVTHNASIASLAAATLEKTRKSKKHRHKGHRYEHGTHGSTSRTTRSPSSSSRSQVQKVTQGSGRYSSTSKETLQPSQSSSSIHQRSSSTKSQSGAHRRAFSFNSVPSSKKQLGSFLPSSTKQSHSRHSSSQFFSRLSHAPTAKSLLHISKKNSALPGELNKFSNIQTLLQNSFLNGNGSLLSPKLLEQERKAESMLPQLKIFHCLIRFVLCFSTRHMWFYLFNVVFDLPIFLVSLYQVLYAYLILKHSFPYPTIKKNLDAGKYLLQCVYASLTLGVFLFIHSMHLFISIHTFSASINDQSLNYVVELFSYLDEVSAKYMGILYENRIIWMACQASISIILLLISDTITKARYKKVTGVVKNILNLVWNMFSITSGSNTDRHHKSHQHSTAEAKALGIISEQKIETEKEPKNAGNTVINTIFSSLQTPHSAPVGISGTYPLTMSGHSSLQPSRSTGNSHSSSPFQTSSPQLPPVKEHPTSRSSGQSSAHISSSSQTSSVLFFPKFYGKSFNHISPYTHSSLLSITSFLMLFLTHSPPNHIPASWSVSDCIAVGLLLDKIKYDNRVYPVFQGEKLSRSIRMHLLKGQMVKRKRRIRQETTRISNRIQRSLRRTETIRRIPEQKPLSSAEQQHGITDSWIGGEDASSSKQTISSLEGSSPIQPRLSAQLHDIDEVLHDQYDSHSRIDALNNKDRDTAAVPHPLIQNKVQVKSSSSSRSVTSSSESHSHESHSASDSEKEDRISEERVLDTIPSSKYIDIHLEIPPFSAQNSACQDYFGPNRPLKVDKSVHENEIGFWAYFFEAVKHFLFCSVVLFLQIISFPVYLVRKGIHSFTFNKGIQRYYSLVEIMHRDMERRRFTELVSNSYALDERESAHAVSAKSIPTSKPDVTQLQQQSDHSSSSSNIKNERTKRISAEAPTKTKDTALYCTKEAPDAPVENSSSKSVHKLQQQESIDTIMEHSDEKPPYVSIPSVKSESFYDESVKYLSTNGPYSLPLFPILLSAPDGFFKIPACQNLTSVITLLFPSLSPSSPTSHAFIGRLASMAMEMSSSPPPKTASSSKYLSAVNLLGNTRLVNKSISKQIQKSKNWKKKNQNTIVEQQKREIEELEDEIELSDISKERIRRDKVAIEVDLAFVELKKEMKRQRKLENKSMGTTTENMTSLDKTEDQSSAPTDRNRDTPTAEKTRDDIVLPISSDIPEEKEDDLSDPRLNNPMFHDQRLEEAGRRESIIANKTTIAQLLELEEAGRRESIIANKTTIAQLLESMPRNMNSQQAKLSNFLNPTPSTPVSHVDMGEDTGSTPADSAYTLSRVHSDEFQLSIASSSTSSSGVKGKSTSSESRRSKEEAQSAPRADQMTEEYAKAFLPVTSSSTRSSEFVVDDSSNTQASTARAQGTNPETTDGIPHSSISTSLAVTDTTPLTYSYNMSNSGTNHMAKNLNIPQEFVDMIFPTSFYQCNSIFTRPFLGIVERQLSSERDAVISRERSVRDFLSQPRVQQYRSSGQNSSEYSYSYPYSYSSYSDRQEFSHSSRYSPKEFDSEEDSFFTDLPRFMDMDIPLNMDRMGLHFSPHFTIFLIRFILSHSISEVLADMTLHWSCLTLNCIDSFLGNRLDRTQLSMSEEDEQYRILPTNRIIFPSVLASSSLEFVKRFDSGLESSSIFSFTKRLDRFKKDNGMLIPINEYDISRAKLSQIYYNSFSFKKVGDLYLQDDIDSMHSNRANSSISEYSPFINFSKSSRRTVIRCIERNYSTLRKYSLFQFRHNIAHEICHIAELFMNRNIIYTLKAIEKNTKDGQHSAKDGQPFGTSSGGASRRLSVAHSHILKPEDKAKLSTSAISNISQDTELASGEQTSDMKKRDASMDDAESLSTIQSVEEDTERPKHGNSISSNFAASVNNSTEYKTSKSKDYSLSDEKKSTTPVSHSFESVKGLLEEGGSATVINTQSFPTHSSQASSQVSYNSSQVNNSYSHASTTNGSSSSSSSSTSSHVPPKHDERKYSIDAFGFDPGDDSRVESSMVGQSSNLHNSQTQDLADPGKRRPSLGVSYKESSFKPTIPKTVFDLEFESIDVSDVQWKNNIKKQFQKARKSYMRCLHQRSVFFELLHSLTLTSQKIEGEYSKLGRNSVANLSKSKYKNEPLNVEDIKPNLSRLQTYTQASSNIIDTVFDLSFKKYLQTRYTLERMVALNSKYSFKLGVLSLAGGFALNVCLNPSLSQGFFVHCALLITQSRGAQIQTSFTELMGQKKPAAKEERDLTDECTRLKHRREKLRQMVSYMIEKRRKEQEDREIVLPELILSNVGKMTFDIASSPRSNSSLLDISTTHASERGSTTEGEHEHDVRRASMNSQNNRSSSEQFDPESVVSDIERKDSADYNSVFRRAEKQLRRMSLPTSSMYKPFTSVSRLTPALESDEMEGRESGRRLSESGHVEIPSISGTTEGIPSISATTEGIGDVPVPGDHGHQPSIPFLNSSSKAHSTHIHSQLPPMASGTPSLNSINTLQSYRMFHTASSSRHDMIPQTSHQSRQYDHTPPSFIDSMQPAAPFGVGSGKDSIVVGEKKKIGPTTEITGESASARSQLEVPGVTKDSSARSSSRSTSNSSSSSYPMTYRNRNPSIIHVEGPTSHPGSTGQSRSDTEDADKGGSTFNFFGSDTHLDIPNLSSSMSGMDHMRKDYSTDLDRLEAAMKEEDTESSDSDDEVSAEKTLSGCYKEIVQRNAQNMARFFFDRCWVPPPSLSVTRVRDTPEPSELIPSTDMSPKNNSRKFTSSSMTPRDIIESIHKESLAALQPPLFSCSLDPFMDEEEKLKKRMERGYIPQLSTVMNQRLKIGEEASSPPTSSKDKEPLILDANSADESSQMRHLSGSEESNSVGLRLIHQATKQYSQQLKLGRQSPPEFKNFSKSDSSTSETKSFVKDRKHPPNIFIVDGVSESDNKRGDSSPSKDHIMTNTLRSPRDDEISEERETPEQDILNKTRSSASLIRRSADSGMDREELLKILRETALQDVPINYIIPFDAVKQFNEYNGVGQSSLNYSSSTRQSGTTISNQTNPFDDMLEIVPGSQETHLSRMQLAAFPHILSNTFPSLHPNATIHIQKEHTTFLCITVCMTLIILVCSLMICVLVLKSVEIFVGVSQAETISSLIVNRVNRWTLAHSLSEQLSSSVGVILGIMNDVFLSLAQLNSQPENEYLYQFHFLDLFSDNFSALGEIPSQYSFGNAIFSLAMDDIPLKYWPFSENIGFSGSDIQIIQRLQPKFFSIGYWADASASCRLETVPVVTESPLSLNIFVDNGSSIGTDSSTLYDYRRPQSKVERGYKSLFSLNDDTDDSTLLPTLSESYYQGTTLGRNCSPKFPNGDEMESFLTDNSFNMLHYSNDLLKNLIYMGSVSSLSNRYNPVHISSPPHPSLEGGTSDGFTLFELAYPYFLTSLRYGYVFSVIRDNLDEDNTFSLSSTQVNEIIQLGSSMKVVVDKLKDMLSSVNIPIEGFVIGGAADGMVFGVAVLYVFIMILQIICFGKRHYSILCKVEKKARLIMGTLSLIPPEVTGELQKAYKEVVPITSSIDVHSDTFSLFYYNDHLNSAISTVQIEKLLKRVDRLSEKVEKEEARVHRLEEYLKLLGVQDIDAIEHEICSAKFGGKDSTTSTNDSSTSTIDTDEMGPDIAAKYTSGRTGLDLNKILGNYNHFGFNQTSEKEHSESSHEGHSDGQKDRVAGEVQSADVLNLAIPPLQHQSSSDNDSSSSSIDHSESDHVGISLSSVSSTSSVPNPSNRYVSPIQLILDAKSGRIRSVQTGRNASIVELDDGAKIFRNELGNPHAIIPPSSEDTISSDYTSGRRVSAGSAHAGAIQSNRSLISSLSTVHDSEGNEYSLPTESEEGSSARENHTKRSSQSGKESTESTAMVEFRKDHFVSSSSHSPAGQEGDSSQMHSAFIEPTPKMQHLVLEYSEEEEDEEEEIKDSTDKAQLDDGDKVGDGSFQCEIMQELSHSSDPDLSSPKLPQHILNMSVMRTASVPTDIVDGFDTGSDDLPKINIDGIDEGDIPVAESSPSGARTLKRGVTARLNYFKTRESLNSGRFDAAQGIEWTDSSESIKIIAKKSASLLNSTAPQVINQVRKIAANNIQRFKNRAQMSSFILLVSLLIGFIIIPWVWFYISVAHSHRQTQLLGSLDVYSAANTLNSMSSLLYYATIYSLSTPLSISEGYDFIDVLSDGYEVGSLSFLENYHNVFSAADGYMPQDLGLPINLSMYFFFRTNFYAQPDMFVQSFREQVSRLDASINYFEHTKTTAHSVFSQFLSTFEENVETINRLEKYDELTLDFLSEIRSNTESLISLAKSLIMEASEFNEMIGTDSSDSSGILLFPPATFTTSDDLKTIISQDMISLPGCSWSTMDDTSASSEDSSDTSQLYSDSSNMSGFSFFVTLFAIFSFSTIALLMYTGEKNSLRRIDKTVQFDLLSRPNSQDLSDDSKNHTKIHTFVLSLNNALTDKYFVWPKCGVFLVTWIFGLVFIFFSVIISLYLSSRNYSAAEQRSLTPVDRYRDLIILSHGMVKIIEGWIAAIDLEVYINDESQEISSDYNGITLSVFEAFSFPTTLMSSLSRDMVDTLRLDLSWSNVSDEFLSSVMFSDNGDLTDTNMILSLYPNLPFYSQIFISFINKFCITVEEREGSMDAVPVCGIFENIAHLGINDFDSFSFLSPEITSAISSDLYNLMDIQNLVMQHVIFFSYSNQFLPNSVTYVFLSTCQYALIFTVITLAMLVYIVIKTRFKTHEMLEKISQRMWQVAGLTSSVSHAPRLLQHSASLNPTSKKSGSISPMREDGEVQSVVSPKTLMIHIDKSPDAMDIKMASNRSKSNEKVRAVYFPEENRLIQQQCLHLKRFVIDTSSEPETSIKKAGWLKTSRKKESVSHVSSPLASEQPHESEAYVEDNDEDEVEEDIVYINDLSLSKFEKKKRIDKLIQDRADQISLPPTLSLMKLKRFSLKMFILIMIITTSLFFVFLICSTRIKKGFVRSIDSSDFTNYLFTFLENLYSGLNNLASPHPDPNTIGFLSDRLDEIELHSAIIHNSTDGVDFTCPEFYTTQCDNWLHETSILSVSEVDETVSSRIITQFIHTSRELIAVIENENFEEAEFRENVVALLNQVTIEAHFSTHYAIRQFEFANSAVNNTIQFLAWFIGMSCAFILIIHGIQTLLVRFYAIQLKNMDIGMQFIGFVIDKAWLEPFGLLEPLKTQLLEFSTLFSRKQTA